MGHMTLITTLTGDLSSIMLELNTAYLCTKFDHSVFSRSEDMIGAHQNLNNSRDLTTPLSETIRHPWARTCYDQPTYQI